ncbi:hypothetical protein ACSVC9_11315 [Clostridium sp. LBM24168]
MFDINNIIAIGGILVGIIGGIFGIISLLKEKNIDRDKELNTTRQIFELSELKPAAAVIDWIEQKAVAGVKAAEQLEHSGSLKTDQEKFTAAQNTVYNALTEIDIIPTNNQKKLIDDFIQGAVNDLGHSPKDEARRNEQLQNIKQKLITLQAENSQLKQTLISIKSTAGTIK